MKDKNFTPPKQGTNLLLILILLLFFFIPLQGYTQTPGMIFQKALSPGPTILDPNGDGYVSKSSTGFVGTADMGTNSEIPYRFLPQMPSPNGPEPLSDLVTGSNGGHTDLANVPLAMFYNSDKQAVMLRVRLGGSSTASKGYSFLLDTDGVFNKLRLANGTLIDYTTPSKVQNLGFEYEVVLALNFDVVVYRHRGSGDQNDPTPMTSNIIWRGSANGGYNKYFQKAIAATKSGGDADYFFDFYVPLSAFQADGGPGIEPDTPMRMSGSTVTSAQTGLEGTISDIGGVDDRTYGNDKTRIWKEIIPKFPPTSLNQLANGDFCAAAPDAPTLSTPIKTNATTITGTSTEVGATVKVFRNGIEMIGTGPVTVSASQIWTLTLPAGTTLPEGSVITAKVIRPASGSCPAVSSTSSNSVSVTGSQTASCSTPAPVINLNSNQKTLSGTTTVAGALIKVYRDGEYFGSTTASTTASGGTYSWSYSGPAAITTNIFTYTKSNHSANYATITATATAPAAGSCESARSNSLYMNTADKSGFATPGTTTTTKPTVLNTVLCSSSITISGTFSTGASEAGSLIYLLVNGYPVKTKTTNVQDGNTASAASSSGSMDHVAVAAADGTWTINISSYGFKATDVLSVRAKTPNADAVNYPSGYKGLSDLASITVSATCGQTATPVLTAPATPTKSFCPTTSTFNGTAETNATVIVYRIDNTNPDPKTNTIQITNAVTANGGVVTTGVTPSTSNWTAVLRPGITLQTGDSLYAVAQSFDGKALSIPSKNVGVQAPTTAASLGLVISSPITEGATSISGTTTASSGTIYLYIDGQKISDYTSTITGGKWTINISTANQKNLAVGQPVTATMTTATGCGESGMSVKVFVDCNKPSTNPSISPLSQNVCSGNPALVTITNPEAGVIYQLYTNQNDASSASGAAVLGDGTSITLRSALLTQVGTSVNFYVKASRAGSACDVWLNGSSTATIQQGVTVYTASAATAAACYNGSATINLSGSQIGVNYQLQILNKSTYPYTYVNSGSSLPGTGSALIFTTPALTAASSFKVVADNGKCATDMGEPMDISVTSINTGLVVTPTSQAICGTGNASVTIKGSQTGVQYQMYNMATGATSGSVVNGTGGDITLNSIALSGTVGSTINFKIRATPITPSGCTFTELTQGFSVTITDKAPSGTTPTASFATGSTVTSSTICSGGTATVYVASSELGVSYQVQLQSGSAGSYTYTNLGSAVPGTGNAINPITLNTSNFTTGTYTLRILARNGCGSMLLTQSLNLTVNSIPTAYTLSPTVQTVCGNGSINATLTLSNSEANITYTLFRQTVNGFVSVTSQTPSLSGAPLTFNTGAIGGNTYFKVTGSNSVCTTDMGETVLVMTSTPQISIGNDNTTYCGSGSNTIVVSNPIDGYRYDLYKKEGNTTTETFVTSITYTSGNIEFYVTVNKTTSFTVKAVKSDCTTISSNAKTLTVNNCTINYNVQPAYQKSDYIDKQVLANPVTSTTKAYTYSLKSGSFLSGTYYDPRTGQIFVNNLKSLESGTRTVIMLASFANEQPIEIPVTYSISPDGNASASSFPNNPTVLPVELISFSATNSAGAVLLTWKTASEKDNERFEVERSSNGKTFIKIGQVAGFGNSNVVRNYSFTDTNPETGTTYYRLKQIDFDGKFEYSKLIAFTTKQSATPAVMTVAPNPFSDKVSVTVTSNQERTVQFEIYSLQQKPVVREIVKLSAGTTLLQRDLHKLPAGVYILRISGEGINIAQKVIKVD